MRSTWPWSRRTEVWCALVRDRQQQVIQRRYARAEQRREEVLAAVQSLAISLMGCKVEPDQPLMEAGLDSLGAHSAQDLPARQLMALRLMRGHAVDGADVLQE